VGSTKVDHELAELLRHEPGLHVAEMSTLADARSPMFPTFLQAGTDVHGSHGLFYWLRARGKGLFLWTDNAGIVLTWRPDVGRLVALRPIGELDAVVDLLDTVAKLTSIRWPCVPLVARYCSNAVATRLVKRGWARPSRPWLPDMPLDDEAYPEVVITGTPLETPNGRQYKFVRNAAYRHAARYSYHASSAPIDYGEAKFITTQTARVDRYDEQEKSFNAVLLGALNFRHHYGITYRYPFRGRQLSGFAITSNTTGVSHRYFTGTPKVSCLSTYFHWKIYIEERRRGALALNLGGSETESLHVFKIRTFPEHVLQQTTILQYLVSG
jgi:hypothetical protein